VVGNLRTILLAHVASTTAVISLVIGLT